MTEHDGRIIVGLLGQWASGKTAAAETLVEYLGGEGKVNFITDRILLAAQATNHILELEESNIKHIIEEDGRQRIEGVLSTVFLGPGEDLRTVDLNTLLFDIHDDVEHLAQPCGFLRNQRKELSIRLTAIKCQDVFSQQ